MRRLTSESDIVVSGQIQVASTGASVVLRKQFPPRWEPKVIVNRRMLLPTRKGRLR